MTVRLEAVHPVLMSSDPSRSIPFFTRLGFTVTFQDRTTSPRYVAITRDDVTLHLQRQDESQWACTHDRPTYRFLVEDVDGLFETFQSAGAAAPSRSPWTAPGDTPWGTREFHMLDPDGNGLQFYRPLSGPPLSEGKHAQPVRHGAGGTVTDAEPESRTVHRWYSRPVLFVADVKRALGFYVETLRFEKRWHEGDGAGGVCQVDRGECEIILCEDAARRDRGRLFIELTAKALADLRRELAERAVPARETWWGSDAIRIEDPDGNELLFPIPE